MANKPNKWIAALLGLFVPALGMFYVGRPAWAVFYYFLQLGIALTGLYYVQTNHPVIATACIVLVPILVVAHAYRVALRASDNVPRPHYSRWYGLATIAAVYLLGTLGIRSFLYEPFAMPARSMEPTLPQGALLITQKWGYGYYGSYGIQLFRAPISAPLERGDILVFEYPENRSKNFVKRLIGLPGDKVSYLDKQLALNGNAVLRTPLDSVTEGDDTSTRTFQRVEEKLGELRYVTYVDEGQPPLFLQHVRNFPMRDRCQHSETGFECIVPAGHYFVMGDNRDNSDDGRYWGFVPADAVVGKVAWVLGNL